MRNAPPDHSFLRILLLLALMCGLVLLFLFLLVLPPVSAFLGLMVLGIILAARRMGMDISLVPRLLTAAAFLMFCSSAYFFRPMPMTNLLDKATYFLVAGGLELWTAIYFNRAKIRAPKAVTTSPAPVEAVAESSHPDAFLTFIGLAALAVLIEINGQFLNIAFLQSVSIHIQFILFIFGLVGLTLGFAGVKLRFPRQLPQPQLKIFIPNRYQLLLIAITLLAFALRTINLGGAVHHFIDEIHFSTAVMNVRVPNNTIPLLTPFNSVTAFTWLYPYVQAWGVGLLGRNLEGLRLLSAVVGTLGIPGLYFLAREFFDYKTALLAALLLAVFPPHIQFSRIGLNNIADPLFGTLALTFLVRGFKYHRPADFAFAGAALGLTQYFYEGGRLLFPLLILLSLSWFMLVKPRFFSESDSNPKPQPPGNNLSLMGNGQLETKNLSSPQHSVPSTQHFSSLITFFVTAALIALPVYSTLIATKQPFDARFQTVGVGGSYWMRVEQLGKPQTLEEHLLIPFLVYVYQPEIALYYGGEQAMLLPYVVPFVLIGVLALLAYWRTPGVILVGWVVLASMGNMLLTESAIYARYVVVFPALALLAAVGIRTLTVLLWPQKSRWRTGVVMLVTAVLCIGQITYFFGPHLARYNEQLRQTFDSEDAIFRSADFPWGTQIHVIEANTPGQVYLSGLANYLTDGLTVFVLPPADLTAAYANALSHSVDHAFFVEPYDDASVILLAKYFKLEGPFDTPFNVPIYRELRLYYAHATVPAG
ncbi:MAG: glycosyltransferase family 39 protein [Chloroflexota bacterium]